MDYVCLTDKSDSIYFERFASSFMDANIPSYFSIDTIFAGQDSTIEITRTRLFNTLNDGTLFLSYYGHGAPERWSKYNIFTYGDIDSLKENNLPFILTSAACEQPFDLPSDSSIVRKLIILPKYGTVASVNSTGLNELNSGSDFLNYFYSNFLSIPDMAIGEAVLQTKVKLETFDHEVDAIPRRYTLLGDPALKLPLNTINRIVRKQSIIPDLYCLYQNYPNPFNPSSTIRYSIQKAGYVTIKVYDILGREIAILVNEFKPSGEYEIHLNGANLSSGIYYYQMRSGDFVDAKKFMLMK